jgi:hypothetical protein
VANGPAQKQLFTVVFIKLNKTNVAHGCLSSLKKRNNCVGIGRYLQRFAERSIRKPLG